MNDKLFLNPPPGYGEVAFFWWHGDRITKEKLKWILEQLKDSHISGLQINYAHSDTGGQMYGLTLDSSPRVFSPEWWELTGWFLEACRPYGISISLSDYTLGSPGQGFYTDRVLEKHPQMGGQRLVMQDGEVKAERVPFSANPIHAGFGEAIIDEFYGMFEEHFPGECGKGINYFFSDELNFNVRGNLWCEDFEEEFQKRKGYGIRPYLRAIFEDMGDITPKVRLDYYDVIVQLSEERYFRPVYEWHEERGMTFGCDHGGRGKDVTEFGDYFRTMKWNQAPGNDQPRLESDIIKNKVASSIAHLYGRKRVWLEGFYGSGWGTSSAQVADAVFRNFAMGHNLLSLHGCYYSMGGSMWEWAPPCNHFHMPYWSEMKTLLTCTERLSWLLSQGVHCCDTAVFYPVCAVEADAREGMEAVKTAFDTGEYLYRHGMDFDFIDFESLERGVVRDGRFCVGDASYRVLIFPGMKAVRYEAFRNAVSFAESGGIVAVLGELPSEDDRMGRRDPLLVKETEKLRARGHLFERDGQDELLEFLDISMERDVRFENGADGRAMVYFQHRKLGEDHLYFLYGLEKGTECRLRAAGEPFRLDPWTGEKTRLTEAEREDGRTVLRMPLEEEEVLLVLLENGTVDCVAVADSIAVAGDAAAADSIAGVDDTSAADDVVAADGIAGANGIAVAEAGLLIKKSEAAAALEGKACAASAAADARNADECVVLTAEGTWECEICPTLDNRFGDYRKPVTEEWIGPEVRVFRFCRTEEDCSGIAFDDSGWQTGLFGHGPYWKRNGEWYRYSLRTGIEGDAGPQHSYHGLKGMLSDEFLCMGEKTVLKGGSDSRYDGTGDFIFETTVHAKKDGVVLVDCGEKEPEQVWIDGTEYAKEAWSHIFLTSGMHNLRLRYNGGGRTHFILRTGNSFRQEYPLSTGWYQNPEILPMDAMPEEAGRSCWFRFYAPPGMERMLLTTVGKAEAYADGERMTEESAGVFLPTHPQKREMLISVRVIQEPCFYECAAIPEPIRFRCGTGLTEAGDWSGMEGLACYSGGVRYRRNVKLEKGKRTVLDLGRVVSSAVVTVNGREAAVLVARPFRADISDWVQDGENRIEVLVHNTLANQMSTYPSAYVGKAESGMWLP